MLRCGPGQAGLPAEAAIPAALVGAAEDAGALDCSRRLSSSQRSSPDSPETPAGEPRLLGLLLPRLGRVPRRCLEGGPHRGDCSVHPHLSHLDMPVYLADWPARVGVPHAESRSIIIGTLRSSFQSYGATRSRSPAPQATVSGKRDSSSVVFLWLSYVFVSRNVRQSSRLLQQNPFHASTNTTFLHKVTSWSRYFSSCRSSKLFQSQ